MHKIFRKARNISLICIFSTICFLYASLFILFVEWMEKNVIISEIPKFLPKDVNTARYLEEFEITQSNITCFCVSRSQLLASFQSRLYFGNVSTHIVDSPKYFLRPKNVRFLSVVEELEDHCYVKQNPKFSFPLLVETETLW
jgi:hypothetical protein